MKASVRYICIGENFFPNTEIGDCGETKALIEWLEHLYPHSSRDELYDYFKSDSNAEIVAYILKNKGKRLEKV